MTLQALTIDQYIQNLPLDRAEAITELRKVINDNLPKGFQEQMSYGMIGYVVPFKIYSNGYHCNPKLPLPFMNFASQKNSINLYHMGIYANSKLLNWFTTEYPKHCSTKLDMGKSCIRFKKMNQISFKLIGELVQKISVKQWIETYELKYKR